MVGIGEASIYIASMLGHRFSIITTDTHSIPIHEDLVKKHHFQDALASVMAPGEEWADGEEDEKYLKTARMAVEEDTAEVIVLGCAGMAGLDKIIQTRLGAPILDGVVCALFIVTGLVAYGASSSKLRRYNPDYSL